MLDKELSIALKAIKEASKAIMTIYNSSDIGLEIKSDNSPVTKADKLADKIIKDILSSSFPNDGFLTEESVDDFSRLEKERVWIIDPVDGTKEFVAHTGDFTVNIALSINHKAVLGVILVPLTSEIYYAVEGLGSFYLEDEHAKPIAIHTNEKEDNLTVLLSRFHVNDDERNMIKKHSDVIKHQRTIGATIKGCLIARGLAEISYRFSSNTKEWDTCAMQVIVEQAGGYILKFDKTPIMYNRHDVYNRGGYIIINKIQNFLL